MWTKLLLLRFFHSKVFQSACKSTQRILIPVIGPQKTSKSVNILQKQPFPIFLDLPLIFRYYPSLTAIPDHFFIRQSYLLSGPDLAYPDKSKNQWESIPIFFCRNRVALVHTYLSIVFYKVFYLEEQNFVSKIK